MKKKLLPLIILDLMFILFVHAESRDSQKEDVRKVLEEYRLAWLANDENRVMKTLTQDAILMPASSKSVIEGDRAIRAYWWPAGSPFTIDEFTQPILEVFSCDGLGYVRGTSSVTWTSMNQGVKTKSQSTTNFLAILKNERGVWRIARLIWYQTN